MYFLLKIGIFQPAMVSLPEARYQFILTVDPIFRPGTFIAVAGIRTPSITHAQGMVPRIYVVDGSEIRQSPPGMVLKPCK